MFPLTLAFYGCFPYGHVPQIKHLLEGPSMRPPVKTFSAWVPHTYNP